MKKLIVILVFVALCIGLANCTNDERNTDLDILTPNDSLNGGVGLSQIKKSLQLEGSHTVFADAT